MAGRYPQNQRGKQHSNFRPLDVERYKAGVTIESVLDDFRISHRRRRCACPVHGGDNRGAFSFSEDRFYCHTHGCKGDVIALLQALLKTDFLGALEYLARRKGLPFNRHESARPVAPLPQPVVKPQVDSPKEKLRARMRVLRARCKCWTRDLWVLRDKRRQGSISECDFYTKTHVADSHLERLDAKVAALNYEIRRMLS